jgi:hypothetical protein
MRHEHVDEQGAEPSRRDTLDDLIFGARDRTTKAFDEKNRDDLTDTIGSIGKISSVQVLLVAYGAHLLDRQLDVFALLKTAIDTLISALHLARQRAQIEVNCLLRSALESSCTALHISQDAKAYEDYLKRCYQSTRSITAAKKQIPIVGELWGALSQVAVHVNRGHHGPKIERNQSDDWVASVDIHFSMRPASREEDKATLALISLTAEIVARAQELSLFEEEPTRPGWRRAPGASVVVSDGGDDAIQQRHQQFLSLAERARRS